MIHMPLISQTNMGSLTWAGWIGDARYRWSMNQYPNYIHNPHIFFGWWMKNNRWSMNQYPNYIHNPHIFFGWWMKKHSPMLLVKSPCAPSLGAIMMWRFPKTGPPNHPNSDHFSIETSWWLGDPPLTTKNPPNGHFKREYDDKLVDVHHL